MVPYRAIWIVLGHLNRPRTRSISTVQDVADVRHRRKDEPTVEDDIKYVVLFLEPIGLILSACKHAHPSSKLRRWHQTSSTGTRWIDLSIEYF